MAALIMPTLGEPQTCDGPCGHEDCAYWRQIVGKACVHCGEPVDGGQRFHFHGDGEGDDIAVVHALCDEEHDREAAGRGIPEPTRENRP